MQRASRAGDADKVLDELLNKYGKVVYTNYNSGKPKSSSPSSSFDDDSESLSRMCPFCFSLSSFASILCACENDHGVVLPLNQIDI